MEELIKYSAQYGAAGLIALGAGWVLYRRDLSFDQKFEKLMDRNEKERASHLAALASQHAEMREEAARGRQALDNNTSVLNRIETLIRKN